MFLINPAFDRFPGEAQLIGKLLAAFGELEVSVCANTSKATNLGNSVLAALYLFAQPAVGWRLLTL